MMISVDREPTRAAALLERWIDTPLGALRLVARGEALAGVYFAEHAHAPPTAPRSDASPALARAEAQLREYFAGTRRAFDLRLDPIGTPWQARVWGELARIPFGETRSYADVARALGSPNGTRAVGHANGRNPLSIVVPCHRVIGADGSLTGYGGGVANKEWLLAHERALA